MRGEIRDRYIAWIQRIKAPRDLCCERFILICCRTIPLNPASSSYLYRSALPRFGQYRDLASNSIGTKEETGLIPSARWNERVRMANQCNFVQRVEEIIKRAPKTGMSLMYCNKKNTKTHDCDQRKDCDFWKE